MKTSIKNRLLLTALSAALGLILAGPVTAQTFTTLHSFTEGIDGVSLQAGLVLSGNVLYGTTEYGGPSGNNSTLFAVNTNGSGFRIVYNFSSEAINNLGFNTNSDAGGSDGTLVLSGNTLYGASYYGGTNGTGAVFAVNTNGTFTALHDFSAGQTNPATGLFTNSDGYGSEAGLILSGSTLYGTTEHGGTSGYGVVFKVNTNGTGFQNLHNFTNGSDGTAPEGLLLQSNILYGWRVVSTLPMPQYSSLTRMGPVLRPCIDFQGFRSEWLYQGIHFMELAVVRPMAECSQSKLTAPVLQISILLLQPPALFPPTETERKRLIMADWFYRATPCMGRPIMAVVRAMARCSP